jgi:hypothetical protein
MDPTKLDGLATLLATSAGRRGALRALLATALGGGAAGAVVVGPAVAGCFTEGRRCRHARQCCSGRCAKGACVPCGKGTTECGHACVDTRTDRGNCGKCERRCAAGQHCAGGVCTCGGARCAGCCAGDVCRPGDAGDACGTGGQACADCSALDGNCTVGVCVAGRCEARINVGAACPPPFGSLPAATVCQADGRCCAPSGALVGDPGSICFFGNCCSTRCRIESATCV